MLRQNVISYPADKVYQEVEVRPPLPVSTLKLMYTFIPVILKQCVVRENII